MSTSTNAPDPPDDDESAEPEALTVRVRPVDVARLDHAAARRGIEREQVVTQAIDAFLAREMWSGGFIQPPPPMETPGPYPWRGGAFRLRRRK